MPKVLTHLEYLERVKEKRNDLDEYEFLTEYTGNEDKITVKHKCGESYELRAKDFKRGDKCFKCSYVGRIHNKRTTEEVKKEISELTDGEYQLVSEYKNNKEKIFILHSECNRISEMNYNKFKSSGRRCQHCNMSNGEVAVEKYLMGKNIRYIKEATFDGCVYKRRLRFDFFLEDNNCIIEFDGKQHFEPSFGTEPESRVAYLKETQLRDSIKNEFCEKNGITLIRISYKDLNNVDKILDKYF